MVPEAVSLYRSDQTHRLTDDEDDPFGHRHYAQALVNVLSQDEPPFTIGLFGPWGSGKTTVLSEVAARLRDRRNDTSESKGSKSAAEDDVAMAARTDVVLALFDAWKYEGDASRRTFLLDVADRLVEEKVLDGKWVEKNLADRFDHDLATQTPAGRFNRSAFGQTVLGSLPYFVVGFIVFFGAARLGLSDKTVFGIVTALTAALAGGLSTALRRLIVDLPTTTTRKRLDSPEQFAERFRAMLTEVKAERVVIAIDNLDRCNADRVDAALATIKTFLEPGVPRSGHMQSLIVFVAADYGALRRHLLTREKPVEAADSTDTDDSQHEYAPQVVPDAARLAVDEYLRKYFNAAIHLSDALDEDMAAFTERQLQPLVQSRVLTAEQAKDMTQLVASGLHRNPRRVKQFINNFLLRHELLTVRQEAKALHAEIDVLMVAKLAVLQEEWRDEYDVILEDPEQLGRWQTRAASLEVKELEHEAPVSRRDLYAFLRATDHVTTRDLRPYLALKESAAERDVPGYARLRTGLLSSNGTMIDAAIKEAQRANAEPALIAATGLVFREAVRRGYWTWAAQVLRYAIEWKALAESPHTPQAEMLDEALSQPNVRSRLAIGVDIGAFLDARHNLQSPAKRRAAFEIVLGRIQSESPLRTVAEHLADYEDTIEPDEWSKVRDAFGNRMEHSQDCAALDPFVGIAAGRAADAIPDQALTLATAELMQADEPVRAESPALRATAALLRRRAVPQEDATAFVQALWLEIERHTKDGPTESADDFLTYAARVVPDLYVRSLKGRADEELPDRIVGLVESTGGGVGPALFSAVVDLSCALSAVVAETVILQAAEEFMRRFSSDQLASWLPKVKPSHSDLGYEEQERLSEKLFTALVACEEDALVSRPQDGRSTALFWQLGKTGREAAERIVRRKVENDAADAVEVLNEVQELVGHETVRVAVRHVFERAEQMARASSFTIEDSNRLKAPGDLSDAVLDQIDLEPERERLTLILVVVARRHGAVASPMVTRFENRLSGLTESVIKGVLSVVLPQARGAVMMHVLSFLLDVLPVGDRRRGEFTRLACRQTVEHLPDFTHWRGVLARVQPDAADDPVECVRILTQADVMDQAESVGAVLAQEATRIAGEDPEAASPLP